MVRLIPSLCKKKMLPRQLSRVKLKKSLRLGMLTEFDKKNIVNNF